MGGGSLSGLYLGILVYRKLRRMLLSSISVPLESCMHLCRIWGESCGPSVPVCKVKLAVHMHTCSTPHHTNDNVRVRYGEDPSNPRPPSHLLLASRSLARSPSARICSYVVVVVVVVFGVDTCMRCRVIVFAVESVHPHRSIHSAATATTTLRRCEIHPTTTTPTAIHRSLGNSVYRLS